MPITVAYSESLSGDAFDLPAGPIAMTYVQDGGGRIALADYEYAGTLSLAPSGNALGSSGDPDWHTSDSRVAVTVNGHVGSLPQAVIDTATGHWAAGGGNGQLAFLGPDALAAEAVTVVAAEHGGTPLLFAATATGAGITAFRLSGGDTPTNAITISDNSDRYLSGVADLVVVETSEGRYLYAGSAAESGISGFRIGANGALSSVDHVGMWQSLPVQTVSALAPAQTGGRDFLIVAASGSSSVTVLRVRADGTLDPTDHVIDDLDTRFQGAARLETVEIDGHVFVLVSGADEGMTVFRLTGEGRLVHLDTLVETGDGALLDPVAIGVLPQAEGALIAMRGEGQTGAHVFRLTFADPGDVTRKGSGALNGTPGADTLSLTSGNGTISGGAGDDLISDGPGSDRLIGGAGRDVFVLRSDGKVDRIMDVEPGRDIIDLSAWPFLNNLDQLEIEATDNGAVLSFGDEELRLVSDDGKPLDADDIRALVPILLSHAEVTLGPLQIAEPTPAQDPFPDTVPEPIMPDVDDTIDDDPDFEPKTDPTAPTGSGPSGELVDGTDGADSLIGTEGDDVILGRGGNDTVIGGDGDDTIAAAAGHDSVDGGAGNDNIGGGTGKDTLLGGDGNDTLGGGKGNDSLEGGTGNDVMAAGPGDDWLKGGPGDDTMGASYGNDSVQGHGGADHLGGGTGKDVLSGGGGSDLIGGGEGNDTVKGGAGADFLAGGGRNDRVEGGAGADTLNGGEGDDVLEGGGGPDTFVFNDMIGGERDVILDFQPGIDTIRLSGITGAGKSAKYGALEIDQVAEGTIVGYNDHHILLSGISVSSLDAGDFLFV